MNDKHTEDSMKKEYVLEEEIQILTTEDSMNDTRI